MRTIVYETKNQPPITVLVWGESNGKPLVRLHSRCLYGEVFGSLDCDCHAQLMLAIDLIRKEGNGVLIYLEQEGRGSGLVNKAKAYALNQERGLDTVDAYRRLRVPVDKRDYQQAAYIIKKLGLKHIRLLTNNPAKVAGLVREGLVVDKVLLRTKPTSFDADYLRVKQAKLKHDLGLT